MESLKIFNYRDSNITFKTVEGTVMVNATEMAKPFNKQASDWTKTQHAKEFIKVFSERKNIRSSDLLVVIKGGTGVQGTWLHQDIALEFSRWLSVDFAIWCNDRIKELLQVGMTALPETLEAMILNPDLVIGLATQVKELRAQNELMKPKAEFYDAVTGICEDVIDMGEAAKVLNMGIGRNKLFSLLREKGILQRNNQPYQEYVDRGWFRVVEVNYTRPDGSSCINLKTMVYQKGLVCIRKIVERWLSE